MKKEMNIVKKKKKRKKKKRKFAITDFKHQPQGLDLSIIRFCSKFTSFYLKGIRSDFYKSSKSICDWFIQIPLCSIKYALLPSYRKRWIKKSVWDSYYGQ